MANDEQFYVFSIVQHCSTLSWQLQCSSATATKSQWREQLLGINLWQRQIAVASHKANFDDKRDKKSKGIHETLFSTYNTYNTIYIYMYIISLISSLYHSISLYYQDTFCILLPPRTLVLSTIHQIDVPWSKSGSASYGYRWIGICNSYSSLSGQNMDAKWCLRVYRLHSKLW